MKYNNIIRKDNKKQHGFRKRLCSIAIASTLFVTSMPTVLFESMQSVRLTAKAANKDDFVPYTDEKDDITAASDGLDDGIYSISGPDDLVRYSKCYISFPHNHQNDTIELAFAGNVSNKAADEFIAIGTESYPFKGKIITAAGSLNKLQLPEALFDYVADTAKIVGSKEDNASPSYIRISRSTNSSNEPVLARHVVDTAGVNDAADWDGNEWQVQIETFSSGTDAAKSNYYAGIVGEMQKGAKMQISLKDGTEAEIKGTSDLGRICGSMCRNTMLTVKSIEGITTVSDDEPPVSATVSNDSYGIMTSSGNVGGIVGSMDDGSVLVMECKPANTAAVITTSNGYAGGIAGYNDGGTIKLDTTAFSNEYYSVGGTITGTVGVGGLYGYYRVRIDDPTTPLPETSLTINPSKFVVSANVNNSGSSANIGGLFGELVNKSVTITDTIPESRTDAAGGTITVSGGTVTMTHSGSAKNIGGIAGTYKPYSLNETLEISNVTVSARNSGAYSGNYGGGIGLIANADETASPAYVKFTNFTLSTATGCGSRYFGGLVGKGDEAFVEAIGTTITASGFHGGAAVGCMSRGVLKLSGTNNFSSAEPSESDVDSIRDGQIVGYRDDTLVYYDGAVSGLSLSSKKVDNIGTWGDILILDGTKLTKKGESQAATDVLIENGNHTITMTEPASSVTSCATYAAQALAMQIAYDNNPIITNSDVAAPTAITFGADVDLTGTGLRGLTRDNKKSDSDTKCTFTGIANTTSIVGNYHTVTLDIENVKERPVYRHAYNGLIGIANIVTIEALTFNGKISLDPNAEMFAGMAAAKSITSFTANTVSTASTAAFTSNSGASAVYLGRLVGNVSGNINVSGGTYAGTVSGNASSESSCYGGVVGRINGTTTSGFSDVTLKGSVSNAGSNSVQKVGGLVAEIVKGSSESRLNLDNISINNLTVNGNASGSSGGLLGYAWYNTAVQGADVNSAEVGLTVSMTDTNRVSVTNGAETPTVNSGSAAGLVYCATGRWLVKSVEFSGFTANVDSASSFGMLVNQGRSGNDGIYMLLPSGYTYTISDAPFSIHTGVFDELVAYSSSGGVTKNGQGVVSIHTKNADGTAFVDALTMNGSGAGNTYTAQTTLGKAKSNPNTRYYYNLDTDTRVNDHLSEIASDPAKRLMSWALNKYACGNINKYFGNPFTSGITNANYDMTGKSWYPVDVDKPLTVNGTFKFYNSELEKNIQAKADTKYSTLSNTTQHYLMHNALFNDVNSKLTVGSITLQGNVGKANGVSGALVFGTVKGTASSESGTAEVRVTDGITLDGIHVHNFDTANLTTEYAPLLINQTSDFSRLTIKNVTVADDDSYKTSNVATLKTKNNVTGSSTYSPTAYPKIATSLIGNAGISTNSKNINVSFEEIKLDGRNGALSTNSYLTNAYHSDQSLFTKATLLNKLQYQSGGGTYNFEKSKDWTGSTHSPVMVTYGSEISDSTERKENFGKEFWYSDGQSQDSGGFTTGNYILPETHSPDSGNASAVKTGDVVSWTAPYNFENFLPYVYTKYIGAANGGVAGAHQLKVNHFAASFRGCGTYNDPYIITSGDDIVNIENIINGDFSDISLSSILLPTKTIGESTEFDGTAKWHGTTGHKSYTKTGTGENITYENDTEIISLTQLRTYLAGAYYKINGDITIESNEFTGLGDISSSGDKFAVFRGVIVGTGNETITNKTRYPLIASSYGSVVKGLTIEVDSSITRSNDDAAKTFKEDATASGCQFYGAVIGQVFGGDNIIDNVYVEFSENASITLSGTAPQVIPVGGYVGVVLNGGVFFRNMTDGTIDGLPNNKTSDGAATLINNSNGTPNMKYLYVNPIIGRVMNGFAVTETSSYRPFENGTRTYPDGTTVGDTNNHVTMLNGTKNYSITDINKNDITSFGMDSIDDSSTITLSSAQALFIMSLITECGLGKSTNGHYTNGTYLKPYDENMATHLADYSEIGKSTSTDYTEKAANDKYSGSTDKLPYLIKHYTQPVTSGSDTIYPAFCSAGDKVGEVTRNYNLVLGGGEDFNLPDGYRGLGALMFGHNHGSGNANNLDNFKENVVFIKSMKTPSDDTVKTISLNMKLYVNLSDNYPTLVGDQVIFKNGFGLINCLQSSGDATHAFQDITIKGSVKYELIDSTTGQHADYNSTNTGKPNPAVGALVGVPVNGSGDLYFENITLDAMSLSGMCYAGGYVGAMNIAAKFHFTGCSTDDLQVFAGGAAGGLIGYMRNQNAKVVADFSKTVNGKSVNGTFGIISIISASESESLSNDGAAGAGGLIGHRKSGSSAAAENITLSNVTICNGSNAPAGGYIGYDPNGASTNATVVRAGGVIGNAGQTTIMNAESVTVKNLNISGKYAGGMTGYILETNSHATFTNCSVITDIDQKCRIMSSASDGSAGGFIGNNASQAASMFDNCSVVGYIISGSASNSSCNVGGLVGYNNDARATVNVHNTWLAGHLLKWGKYTGGLVGSLNNGALNGYNILIKDQTSLSSTANGYKNGCIVGNNASNNGRVIKIAGFSRQGTVEALKMVGSSSSANSEGYGSGGYVVFSDYNDTASAVGANQVFSDVKANDTTNVDPPLEGQFSEYYKSESELVTYERTYKYIVKDGEVQSDIIEDSGYQETERSAYDSSSDSAGTTYDVDAVHYGAFTPSGASDLIPVTSIEELKDKEGTTEEQKQGFYIYCGKGDSNSTFDKFAVSVNGAVYNSASSKQALYEGAIQNAVTWYFEYVNGVKFKIYTKINGTRYYIKQNGNSKYLQIDANANNAAILEFANAYDENKTWNDNHSSNETEIAKQIVNYDFYKTSFYIKNSTTSWYFNLSSGNGFRFWNQHFELSQKKDYDSNRNQSIRIYYTPPAYSIQGKKYTSFSLNGTTVTTNAGADLSAAEAEAYESDCATRLSAYESDPDYSDYYVYYITETKKEIVTLESSTLRAAPYVTVNDKRMVDGTRFLTGDGIYNSRSDSAYAGSAIAAIITDAAGNTAAKRYQSYGSSGNYPLSSDDATVLTLPKLLSDQRKYLTYKAARGSTSLPTELSSLPVLIIDDISADNTTKLVNSYLRLLTNTSYDYTELNASVYKVRLATCTYTKSGSDYTLGVAYSNDNSTGVNLKLDTANNRFKIGGAYDNSDKNVEQFTLIDVEYYDPSDPSKVAYHLYVPVFVKKMLHYSFTSAAISGSTYRLQPYEQALDEFKKITIIENLGNPITMQFNWTYEQTFDEWMDLINAGEKLNRKYDKQLEFTDHTAKGLPTGTRLVLVDANRNNPAYYAEKTTTDLITYDENRAITCFNLDKFTNTAGAFAPLEFNDFFDVLDTEPTTEANTYVKTDTYFVSADNEEDAKIKTNGGLYYKPSTSATPPTGSKQLYIRYKPGMYNEESGHLVERYYLTFFTPEPTTVDVYHLEFNSPQTFGVQEFPSNASSRIPTHIFTGDIFANSCTINHTNGISEMSANANNWIGATMTANLGLKSAAGNIIQAFINNDSVSIYQSFLIQLNKSYYTDVNMTNHVSEKGFAEGSNPNVEVLAFTVNETALDTIHANTPTVNTLAGMSGNNALIDAHQLELRSNVNLKLDMYNTYTANPTGDATFPVTATVKLTYSDDDTIQAQFPENTDPNSEKGRNIGTNITGASNISSQAEAAAYSKTSKNGTDNTKYYMKSSKKASLNYYSADTETYEVTPASENTPAVNAERLLTENKYGQFGINALDPVRDTDDDSILDMKTQADYNILNIPEDKRNDIKSMKVTVTLRRKADYEDTGKLPIEQFLVPDSLTLYQKEIGDDRFTKMTSTDTDFVYYVNCTKNDFNSNIYRIPINFSVYTGDNNLFANKTYMVGEETKNIYYSNYMVKINVELYDRLNATGTKINGSEANDHIIYTNARMYYDIVANN